VRRFAQDDDSVGELTERRMAFPNLLTGIFLSHKAFLPSETFPVARGIAPTELHENFTCIHAFYRTL
jgi:hypothetical protein